MVRSYDVIKTFLTFAESETIVEAAKKLKLTQPAVSQHLKSFEQSYEKPVFLFRGKRKELTSFGQDIYEALNPHYKSIDSLNESLENKYKDLSKLKIKIGGRVGAMRKIYQIVTFPGSVEYVNMGSDEVVSAVSMGTIDYGFSRREIDSFDFFSKKVSSIPIHMVAHRSLFKSKPTLSNIKKKEFFEENDFYTYSLEAPYIGDWCKEIEFEKENLKTKGILSDWNCILDLVSKKEGYTFCPDNYFLEDRNLVKIALPKSIVNPLELYLIYTRATKKFFDLEKVFDINMLDGHKLQKMPR